MNDALITLDNLSIGYNGQPVLSGISLSIGRDRFTAILGANGSGKSTLLKTLLGLLPPVAGRIDTTQSPTGARLVFGYVPQSIQFDPIYLLTGFDVALMGTYGRVRPCRFVPSTERAFTRECLHAAGAEELAPKRFSDLSSGQKQRVLIARALATRPDVLVLDEPTAGVDAEATHTVLEFISRTREERQITVLLVTHDFAAIRHYAQQVLWLHQGKVLQGAPDELLNSERIAEIFGIGIG
ncbi:MAG TPA: metal ABC transporter ATP-binding protein [Deltaproteobacteria bacterium]|jgi:ABC-type Mn2+/Zn2+ transport system ATPase subunit|nr:metal ABC transporter ATP-binding protein [Deltaproteobacteria bacterium]